MTAGAVRFVFDGSRILKRRPANRSVSTGSVSSLQSGDDFDPTSEAMALGRSVASADGCGGEGGIVPLRESASPRRAAPRRCPDEDDGSGDDLLKEDLGEGGGKGTERFDEDDDRKVEEEGGVVRRSQVEAEFRAADADELRALLPMLREIRSERRRSSVSDPSDRDRGLVSAVVSRSAASEKNASRSATASKAPTDEGPSFVAAASQDGRCYDREGSASPGSARAFLYSLVSSALYPASTSEEDRFASLSPDMYSVLLISDPSAPPFTFALFTFLFQIGILTLILLDTFDLSKSGNPLGFPAGVGESVRVAQFLAILVAVVTQDDVLTSISSLHYGYHPDALCCRISMGGGESGGSDLGVGEAEEVMKKGSVASAASSEEGGKGGGAGGSFSQWSLSIFLRFVQGGLSLLSTFIIVMRGDDVLGIFVDFLAMTFVSEVDDIVFALGREGFFGSRVRRVSADVMAVRIPRKSPTLSRRLFRPAVFIIVTSALVAGWAVVATKQKEGEYLTCNTVSVQFSDEFLPELAHFSGLYDVDYESDRIAGKVSYVARPNPYDYEGRYGKAAFAYCYENNAWTFSYSDPGEEFAPCDWYAKSVETDAHDIMTIKAEEWSVLDPQSSEPVPFRHLSVRCNDCVPAAARAAGRSCSSFGTCHETDRTCVCDSGRYGSRCEFDEPCAVIELDETRDGFPGGFGSVYELLYANGPDDGNDSDNGTGTGTLVEVYGRPVYVSEQQGGFDVILFTGRRWAAVASEDIAIGAQAGSVPTRDELVRFLRAFHGYWYRDEVKLSYASDPNDVETPTDAVSPVGLAWFRAKSYNNAVDPTRPIDALLLCSICSDETNQCLNKGVCVNGTCDCDAGTFGPLCQVAKSEVCQRIKVQFGDEEITRLGMYSGPYGLADPVFLNGRMCSYTGTSDPRAVYVEDRFQSAMFAYCRNFTFWAFISWDQDDVDASDAASCVEPCSNYTARSVPSTTFDITSLSNWFVRRNQATTVTVPFSSFSLWCHDCAVEDLCGCSGRCVGGACVCDGGRYGGICQFNAPCREMVADESKAAFPGDWPTRFAILADADGTDLAMYDRPVYFSEAPAGSFYVILFAGRRWVAMMTNQTNVTTADELADRILNLNPFEVTYGFNFASEAVDVGTDSDAATPIRLRWFEKERYADGIDPDRPLEVSLICSNCNDADYPCYHGGECEDGVCVCKEDTFGTLCQGENYR